MIMRTQSIADIHRSSLTHDTLIYLINKCEPEYKDVNLKEHMYNPGAILEEADNDERELPEQVYTELQTISDMLYRNNCAYMRIIY